MSLEAPWGLVWKFFTRVLECTLCRRVAAGTIVCKFVPATWNNKLVDHLIILSLNAADTGLLSAP